MKKCLLVLLAVTLLPCMAVTVRAEQLVREFSGSRSTETADFEVKAPWLIDWRVNSDFPDTMGIAVALVNAPAGTHAGKVMKTKYPGNGLRLMSESGRFRFKVDASVAYWTLKVIQLTEEEAARYTPKE